MFENDYIMRLIIDLAAAIRRSIEHSEEQRSPSEAARMLDMAVGDAVDMDSEVFLSLSPESASSILNVSGTDPKVVNYVAHSLLLASHYYNLSGENAIGALRAQQARALAQAYGCDLPDDEMSPDMMEEFLDEMSVEELLSGGSDDDGAASVDTTEGVSDRLGGSGECTSADDSSGDVESSFVRGI